MSTVVVTAIRAHGHSAALRTTFEGPAHHVSTGASEAGGAVTVRGVSMSVVVSVATHLNLHGLLEHHHHRLLLGVNLLHRFHLRHLGRLHLHGLHGNLLHSLHGHGLTLSLVFGFRLARVRFVIGSLVNLFLQSA
jgi:hypothetical protein